MARIIGALQAQLKFDPAEESPTYVRQGTEVDLSPEEEQRLDEEGALVPEGLTFDEWADGKQDEYRAGRGDTDAMLRLQQARQGGIVELGPGAATEPMPGTDDEVRAIAEQLRDERLTADETVALAGDDPEKARVVLAAEHQASGQEPRKGVVTALSKIIESEE
jgi:hypothetical protein